MQVSLPTPGQRALLAFDGTAGQRVSALMSNSTISGYWTRLAIVQPDGTTLAYDTTYTSSISIGPVTLPVTGTYTLLLDPPGASTGQATVTLITCVTTSFSASPTSIVRGDSVTATWSGICLPTSTDWIGLYTPGAADTAYLSWRFTTGTANGSVSYTIPATLAPGTYELRLFSHNGYTRLAISNAFTVTSQ